MRDCVHVGVLCSVEYQSCIKIAKGKHAKSVFFPYKFFIKRNGRSKPLPYDNNYRHSYCLMRFWFHTYLAPSTLMLLV